MSGVVLVMTWNTRSAVIGRFVGTAFGHASVTLPSANVPAPHFASAPSMDECASGGDPFTGPASNGARTGASAATASGRQQERPAVRVPSGSALPLISQPEPQVTTRQPGSPSNPSSRSCASPHDQNQMPATEPKDGCTAWPLNVTQQIFPVNEQSADAGVHATIPASKIEVEIFMS